MTAAEEAGPALSHWNSAKPGSIATLWASKPQWVTRYVGEIRDAHSLSVFGDATRAARILRHRFLNR